MTGLSRPHDRLLGWFNLALVLAIIHAVSACGAPSSSSQVQAFGSPRAIQSTTLDFQLSRTELPHRVTRFEVAGGRYDFDRYTHEVQFPALSRAEFDRLKAIYSGFSVLKSSARYVPGRSYTLAEFLPPIMQGIMNLKFAEEATTISLGRSETASAATVANCWGTVYEVLREAKLPMGSFSLFYAHDDVMQAFLRNPVYSSIVRPYTKNPEHYADAATRNRGLEPGDVLVVGNEWLYHVAIFIDNDLFFEKSGSGSNTLFRLVTFDLLAKTWSPELYGWSYRRFDGEPLPDAMSLFGVRRVFANDPKMRAIPDSVAADLSVVRSEVNGNQRYNYFLRKRYPIR